MQSEIYAEEGGFVVHSKPQALSYEFDSLPLDPGAGGDVFNRIM